MEVTLSPETLSTLQSMTENGYWLPMPVAVILSTIIGAFLGAFLGYNIHKRIAKQNNENQRHMQAHRATLDFIAKREIDADILRAKSAFNKQRDSSDGFTKFLSNSHPDIKEHVKTILNDYELTALAVHTGIFDEKFYKRWFESSYLKDYHSVRPFIREVRDVEGNEQIYKEFEQLAVSWGAPLV